MRRSVVAPGQMPAAAAGLRVQPFAAGLAHPRWLLTLPNGDVLVAETAAPATVRCWWRTTSAAWCGE